jgi:antitoxin component YwqK of YwqJK toxin-antitoxin module
MMKNNINDNRFSKFNVFVTLGATFLSITCFLSTNANAKSVYKCGRGGISCEDLGKKLEAQNMTSDALGVYKHGCIEGERNLCAVAGGMLWNSGSKADAIQMFTNGCDSLMAESCLGLAKAEKDNGNVGAASEALKKGCLAKSGEACDSLAQIYSKQGDIASEEEAEKAGCLVQYKDSCETQKTLEAKISGACASDQFLNSDHFTKTTPQHLVWICVKDGKKNGKMIVWTKPGQQELGEMTYKDDVLNGPYKEYDINEKPVSEGQYKDGNKVGLWKYTDEAGKTRKESDQDRNRVAQKEANKKLEAERKKKTADEAQRVVAAAAASVEHEKHLSKMYCICEAGIAALEKMKAQEADIGAESGYVDKEKLYAYGSQIVLMREYKSTVLQSRAPASACTTKPTLKAISSCHEAAGWWKVKELQQSVNGQ